MKEVSSCQENIDMEVISGRKKKKAEFVAQPNGPFAGESAQLSWKFGPGSNQKAYQIIPNWLLNLSGLLHLSYSMDGPFSISDHYRGGSVAEASLVNHERFPGRDVLTRSVPSQVFSSGTVESVFFVQNFVWKNYSTFASPIDFKLCMITLLA